MGKGYKQNLKISMSKNGNFGMLLVSHNSVSDDLWISALKKMFLLYFENSFGTLFFHCFIFK